LLCYRLFLAIDLWLQVMTKLKLEATGVKRHIVTALLAASNTFIMARRLLQGTDLRHAVHPASAASKLVALMTAALLAPAYALAQQLLFSKVGVKQQQQGISCFPLAPAATEQSSPAVARCCYCQLMQGCPRSKP
jgi:hypothetical protein